MTEFEPSRTESDTEPASTDRSSSAATERRAEAIHDFSAKLRQESLWPNVRRYVEWQRELRGARRAKRSEPTLPDLVPLSINLDLTTACNYRCDHCIDWDILNAKVKHADETLRAQMTELAARGMRSVILIGGGEPTLYPGFVEFVRHLKDLKLQVAVVSNGSRNDKILEIAPFLEKGDWVRLSLDSGSNDVFQRMHKPSRDSLTLDEICAWVPKIKRANPHFEMGYSYIITWRGGMREDVKVVENIHEIESGTRRARDAGFDYISFKPFLVRADSGSEIMDPAEMEGLLADVIARIKVGIDASRAMERPGFAVRESTNLRMLVQSSWRDFTKQPQMCHMQSLRQVLSPHGTFNCPAYRGVSYARVGGADLYKDAGSVREASQMTSGLLDNFDASKNCAQVTCLYNGTNWWLEKLIESEEPLDAIEVSADRHDAFL